MGRYTHSHHAIFPVLVIPPKRENYNSCSPQCAFAIIQPPMTQGQGEGKVKLHTMNEVVAGSPLTDMEFVCLFCSKYSGVSVTLLLSLTVPFLPGGGKKFHGILVNSVVHVGRTHGRSVVLGPSAH